MVRHSPANAGDTRDLGSIPGSGRSPRGGNGNPLQYSCMENYMDRGAWGGGYSPWGRKESDTTEHTTDGLTGDKGEKIRFHPPSYPSTCSSRYPSRCIL